MTLDEVRDRIVAQVPASVRLDAEEVTAVLDSLRAIAALQGGDVPLVLPLVKMIDGQGHIVGSVICQNGFAEFMHISEFYKPTPFDVQTAPRAD